MVVQFAAGRAKAEGGQRTCVAALRSWGGFANRARWSRSTSLSPSTICSLVRNTSLLSLLHPLSLFGGRGELGCSSRGFSGSVGQSQEEAAAQKARGIAPHVKRIPFSRLVQL